MQRFLPLDVDLELDIVPPVIPLFVDVGDVAVAVAVTVDVLVDAAAAKFDKIVIAADVEERSI